MDKKQHFDEGLEYINSLGIEKHNSRRALDDKVIRKFGPETKKWVQSFSEIIDDDTKDRQDTGFKRYELKNDNIARAIYYTGGYDSDIIRKSINWIAANKGFFGKTILDVGCDIGLVSCYLAEAFPESHIVSIDKGTNWINVARYLAETKKLTNIEFKQVCVQELGNEKFDTVFSMRTMHENCDDSQLSGVNYLSKMVASFENATRIYAKVLTSHINPGGNLISLEKCDISPLLLGWMNVLNELNFAPLLDTYQCLKCKELGEEVCIQAAVYKQGESIPAEILYDLYCGQFPFIDAQQQIEGYAAELYHEKYRGEAMRSYFVFNPETNINVGMFEICEHKKANGSYIFYVHTGGANPTVLLVIDETDLPAANEQLDQILKTNKENGLGYRSTL